MRHYSNYILALTSWNSEPFLRMTLDSLVENKQAFNWFYVKHDGYTSQVTGTEVKDHFHVEIVAPPGESESIIKEFKEPDPDDLKHPIVPQCEDKERHIPLMLQLEHALLYDLHDLRYCQSRDLEKPYYDIEYTKIVTSSQEWLSIIRDKASDDYWLKLVKKPSKEAIHCAIIDGKSVFEGDRPLTAIIALRRHWIDAFSFRLLLGYDIDNKKAEWHSLNENVRTLKKEKGVLTLRDFFPDYSQTTVQDIETELKRR